MFDHKHYVPVLRWRPAEWCALKDLDDDIKNNLTPLIELLPKDFEIKPDSRKRKSTAQIIDNKISELTDCWGKRPFFLDFQYIENNKANGDVPVQEAFAAASKSKGLITIPVLGFGKNQNNYRIMKNVAKTLNSGLCIRIYPDAFYDIAFQRKLENALEFFGFKSDKIDLVFDNQIPTSNSISLKAITERLPELLKWRTISLMGGSFPIDLSCFSVGEHELSRDDYLSWLSQIQKKGVPRYPSFGDYTVQHPFIRNLSGFPNFSASIRYTSKKYWIIMRGQSVRSPNSSGYAQWPANAAMLCLRNEFLGHAFSKGDEYIFRMGKQIESSGNATTWIKAGINHHLTFVVRQLATLSGS
jgi:hypothetical protein